MNSYRKIKLTNDTNSYQKGGNKHEKQRYGEGLGDCETRS